MRRENACWTHFVAVVNGTLVLGQEKGSFCVSHPHCCWQLLILERVMLPFVLEPLFIDLCAFDKVAHSKIGGCSPLIDFDR